MATINATSLEARIKTELNAVHAFIALHPYWSLAIAAAAGAVLALIVPHL